MAKASPIQTSFTAGEFSPSLEGRVDIAKYASSCNRIDNFFPLPQGPLRRRSGTHFVAEVKDSDNLTHLLRFEFSEFDAYILEFGDGYIRFYTNHGQLLIDDPAAWVTSTAYTVGDLVEDSGTNYYCTTAHTSGTFATDLAAGKWYALTGNIYEIPSPYGIGDLANPNGTFVPRTVQTGDVIYIAHGDFAPRKLSRFGNTRWIMEEIDFAGGPFEDINPDLGVELYTSDVTGSITITANTAFFSADDVGKLIYIEESDDSYVKPWAPGQELSKSSSGAPGANILNTLRRNDGKTYRCVNSIAAPASSPPSVIRTGANAPTHTYGIAADGDGLSKGSGGADPTVSREGVDWEFQDPGYGWARITGFTSTTVVSATVISRFPDSVANSSYASNRWAFSQWFEGNYPSQVAFFRERLCFATGQILNFSVVGDFENFSAKNDSGEVVADQAIKAEVLSDSVNKIEWLAPSDGLLIGTTGGEFLCKEVTRDEPFGPGNIKVSLQSAYGARSVIPLQVGESVVYAQKAGRRLRDLVYDFGTDKFKSADLNILADHIFGIGTEEGSTVTTRTVTNYLIQSEEISGSSWSTVLNGGTIDNQGAVGPDGQWATKITWGSSYPQVQLSVSNFPLPSFVLGEVYAASFYLKAGTQTGCTWQPFSLSAQSTTPSNTQKFEACNCGFNALTGETVPYGSVIDSGMIPMNNGWYRCWVTYEITQDVIDAGWSHNFTIRGGGQGFYFYVDGFQVEIGANSYVPSTSYTSTTTSVRTSFIPLGEKNGCLDLAYQQEPHSIIWAIRGSDGALIGLTFNKEQDVIGWHKHFLGGDAYVESIDCIPHPEGRQDDLWLIARRTINNETKRYVEYMERDFDASQGDVIANAFFVDSGLTYAGIPADTISGLDHLEGMEVAVNANGAPHPNVTVESGSITLDWETPYAHIGLPYTSVVRTQRLEAGAGDGTAQGKTKRINKVVFRFDNSLAANVGPSTSITDPVVFRDPSLAASTAIVPFSGDKLVEWPNGYDFDGYIVVSEDGPMPLTVVAIMPQVTTQDR